MFFQNFSIAYTFFRFSVISCVNSAINVLLYENGSFQLLSLGFVYALLAVLTVSLQLAYNSFNSQIIFVLDVIASCCMIFYNFCLYLKHFSYENNKEIQAIIESMIIILCYTITVTIVLSILCNIFEVFYESYSSIISCLGTKKKKKFRTLNNPKTTFSLYIKT